ncbi:MAG: type ISP restriction/modification enzyme [Ktedonobacteraceae bacterium]
MGTKEVRDSRLVESSNVEFKSLFRKYSVGIHTARDRWVYNFDRNHLANTMKNMIETYNLEIARWADAGCPKDIDSFVLADEAKIKWSNTLKIQLARQAKTHFRTIAILPALYRPFCKQYLYLDNIMIDRRGLFSTILPTSNSKLENTIIVVSDHGSRSPFSVIATNIFPDLHLLATTDAFQCFPYYTYAEDGSNRRENITDWALEQFRARYGEEVSKWDIFHSVYAMLHHPQYRERYAENLKRDLPHIPLLKRVEAFTETVRLGRALMDLHVNYEQQPEYPLTPLEDESVPYEQLTYVEKMKLTPDRTALVVSKGLTLAGLPVRCFEYRLGNRPALEWVIDQYQVSKDVRSGISSNPNRVDDPEYIVRLVKQVVTVSVRTVELVEELARAVMLEDWLGDVTF